MATFTYNHPTDGTEIMLTIEHRSRGIVSTSYHANADDARSEGEDSCDSDCNLSYYISQPGKCT